MKIVVFNTTIVVPFMTLTVHNLQLKLHFLPLKIISSDCYQF